MRSNKPISVSVENGNAIIRFIRSEIKNPLSIETLNAVSETFSALDSNKEVSSVIFTGENGAFAAGANLNEVELLNEETAVEYGLRGQRLMQLISESEKRTVAAIDGFCMGGALDLAISCDQRISSSRSFFAHPGAKLGIITGWGGTQRLPRLIGKKRALRLLLTAEKISAKEALRIKLVDELSSDPLKKALEK